MRLGTYILMHRANGWQRAGGPDGCPGDRPSQFVVLPISADHLDPKLVTLPGLSSSSHQSSTEPPLLPPPPTLCRVHRLSEPFCTRVVFVLIWWRDVHFVINTFYDDFLYVRFINKIKLFLNHDPLIKNNRWKRWAMHYLLLLQTYLFQYSTIIVTASMYWNSVVHCDVKWSAKRCK